MPRGDPLTFRVVFSELAVRQFRRLDRPVRERIGSKLRTVARDPRRHLTRLRLVGAFKLRIGDYRLVIDADWEGEFLAVLSVRHRSTAYR